MTSIGLNWIPRLTIIILTISFELIRCHVIRYYNHISHQTFDSFSDFALKHVDREKNQVTQNLIIGLADEPCWKELEQLPFFLAVEHFAGGSSMQSISMRKSLFPHFTDDPSLAEECLVILSYRIGDSLSAPFSMTANLNHLDFSEWIMEQTRRTISFANSFPFPINVYFHSESADPAFQFHLRPNESAELTTFLGHLFSASIPEGSRHAEISPLNEVNDRPEYHHVAFRHIVDFLVVKETVYEFSSHNRLETCEIVSRETLAELSFVLPSSSDPNSGTAVDAFGDEGVCNNLLLRFIEFSHRIWYEKRLGSNFVQPKIVRPVTNEGFLLRRLPQQTYDWLLRWYREEQLKKEQSETIAGPCMNQHVAPSTITHIEPLLKDRFENEVRPILEEWYGGELYLTSIYGIRKYINGSILRMHVDTVRTHVVSAIVNVDQEVETDWPLVILDHEDNEHSVIMKPGDMLLYESAKLLHGRPDPFRGSHYDNIFIHFRPVNTDEWNYDWL